MKTYVKYILFNALWLGLTATAFSQAPTPNRITVPLSDPSRSATVKVSLLTGSISVNGYAGKVIIADTKYRDGNEPRRPQPEDTAGLKRIATTGLAVEEDNNVVSISTGSFMNPCDIFLKVPFRTTLMLKTVNDGTIVVEQVQGEIEVSNINGPVMLNKISGNVVAHALNGNVKVTLVDIEPDKPMSFSSLNGNIDVSFPENLKANFSMRTDNGEIYSGFDIKFNQAESKDQELEFTKRQGQTLGLLSRGGGFKIKMNKNIRGTVNGGGPEIQFKTFNGNIYIRKLAK